MCSKHVEAWNKLIIKFSASSWLILINKYIEMHGQQKKKNICIYIYIYLFGAAEYTQPVLDPCTGTGNHPWYMAESWYHRFNTSLPCKQHICFVLLACVWFCGLRIPFSYSRLYSISSTHLVHGIFCPGTHLFLRTPNETTDNGYTKTWRMQKGWMANSPWVTFVGGAHLHMPAVPVAVMRCNPADMT